MGNDSALLRQPQESLSLSCLRKAEKVCFGRQLHNQNQCAEVFSFGSGEKGQLGNGRTGEHITTGNKSAYDIEPEPGCVVFFLFQYDWFC